MQVMLPFRAPHPHPTSISPGQAKLPPSRAKACAAQKNSMKPGDWHRHYICRNVRCVNAGKLLRIVC